jgi:molecular chaperone IbpA
MTSFDFAPLYRSTVGFDHLAALLDSVANNDRNQPTYPPYNIELLDKDKYRITMAIAGFAEDEITIVSENNTLTVSAAKSDKTQESKRTFLHQGIAERNFKRQFRLADHVKVTGASLSNGLLNIELQREIPEAMKPRQIPINGVVSGVVAQQFLKSA